MDVIHNANITVPPTNQPTKSRIFLSLRRSRAVGVSEGLSRGSPEERSFLLTLRRKFFAHHAHVLQVECVCEYGLQMQDGISTRCLSYPLTLTK